MNEELELFCEDADEQLTFMENALISMQEDGVDDESIGALFRSMHTIKGTAGMFGFDDLVSFTHVAENLLSEVREGKVALTDEMIDTFLKVKDHAQKLVDLAIENEPLDEFTQVNNDELIKILKSMLFKNANNKQVDENEVISSNVEEDKEAEEKLWHISLRLKADFFATGMDIINILSFFDMLGKIKNLLLIDTKVPDIVEINPTEAYIGYEILFSTNASYEEIEEIFEFVLEDIELQIFLEDDLKRLQTLVDAEDGLREELVFGGFENAMRLRTSAANEKSEVIQNIQPVEVSR